MAVSGGSSLTQMKSVEAESFKRIGEVVEEKQNALERQQRLATELNAKEEQRFAHVNKESRRQLELLRNEVKDLQAKIVVSLTVSGIQPIHRSKGFRHPMERGRRWP